MTMTRKTNTCLGVEVMSDYEETSTREKVNRVLALIAVLAACVVIMMIGG